MSGQCFAAADAGRISALMSSVDCRVDEFVAAAYGALFGDVGWLGPVLTAGLTIYVAIYGYQLMTGLGQASLPDLAKRLFAVGAVIAFSTNWAAYQTAVVDLVFGAGEEVANALASATGPSGASAPVVARLDDVFEDITDLASTWSRGTRLDAAAAGLSSQPATTTAPVAPGQQSAINMLWFSALALALSSAGVLVIAKVLLGFLLAIGPIFILLGIFPTTRGLFEGWLGAVAANAIVPVFALLASAGALGVVEPIVAQIALDQRQGVNDAEPVFVLSIAALVFALLMAMAVATAAKIGGTWRLPSRQVRGAASDAAPAKAELIPLGDARVLEIAAAAGRGAEPASDSYGVRRATAVDILFPAAREDARDADFAARMPARAYRGFGASRLHRGTA